MPAQHIRERESAHQAAPPAKPRLVGYVSDTRLAELLDCSASTIRDYCKRGLLPKPYRIGGMTRWKWTEVETMIEGRTGSGEEEDPILRASRGT
ncbi:Helix-turn-helix domain-containing protein [Tranquillimonas rosea]|uniref:Helix-turn-helix domain-containing protein n=1 Tax=Tranquillimonas rosea TaxID=641238 RepID=A0A1H9PRK9_9RHOB|nr:Helix-turn-helix domain-containing protein [Tranquillimonas rosea]